MNESDYCPVTFEIVEDLARNCGEAFVYFDDKRKLEKYSRDKVGHKRRDYMSLVMSEAHLDMMRKIKRALDPKNILIPGKVFNLV